MKESTQIKTRSYSPFSLQKEGCFVVGTSGTAYPGVRIENSSFPLTITAIQAAFCSCLGNNDQPTGLYLSDDDPKTNSFWKNEFKTDELLEQPQSPNHFRPVIPTPTDMFSTLKKLSELSVTPHSAFPVSAVLETEQGFIPGVNIEFSNWQIGLCAERVAISRAISAGIQSYKSIHIYTPKGDYCSPCGACRQVLQEFMPTGAVILHHRENETTRHFVKQLLPNAFVAQSLNKYKK